MIAKIKSELAAFERTGRVAHLLRAEWLIVVYLSEVSNVQICYS